MRIEVTQEDINRGFSRDCAACPIALAIERAMPGHSVRVSGSTTLIGEPGQIYAWNFAPFWLPRTAVDFVRAFDRGRPVAPFAFELPLEQMATTVPR